MQQQQQLVGCKGKVLFSPAIELKYSSEDSKYIQESTVFCNRCIPLTGGYPHILKQQLERVVEACWLSPVVSAASNRRAMCLKVLILYSTG